MERGARSTMASEENRTAGSSTLTLLLLGLLGTILAGEQMLAYWASYHVPPSRAEGGVAMTQRSASMSGSQR